jgi:hypothetical protein
MGPVPSHLEQTFFGRGWGPVAAPVLLSGWITSPKPAAVWGLSCAKNAAGGVLKVFSTEGGPPSRADQVVVYERILRADPYRLACDSRINPNAPGDGVRRLLASDRGRLACARSRVLPGSPTLARRAEATGRPMESASPIYAGLCDESPQPSRRESGKRTS